MLSHEGERGDYQNFICLKRIFPSIKISTIMLLTVTTYNNILQFIVTYESEWMLLVKFLAT